MNYNKCSGASTRVPIKACTIDQNTPNPSVARPLNFFRTIAFCLLFSLVGGTSALPNSIANPRSADYLSTCVAGDFIKTTVDGPPTCSTVQPQLTSLLTANSTGFGSFPNQKWRSQRTSNKIADVNGSMPLILHSLLAFSFILAGSFVKISTASGKGSRKKASRKKVTNKKGTKLSKVCTKCEPNKGFNTDRGLRDHCIRVHPCVCKGCGIAFPSNNAVRSHSASGECDGKQNTPNNKSKKEDPKSPGGVLFYAPGYMGQCHNCNKEIHKGGTAAIGACGHAVCCANKCNECDKYTVSKSKGEVISFVAQFDKPNNWSCDWCCTRNNTNVCSSCSIAFSDRKMSVSAHKYIGLKPGSVPSDLAVVSGFSVSTPSAGTVQIKQLATTNCIATVFSQPKASETQGNTDHLFWVHLEAADAHQPFSATVSYSAGGENREVKVGTFSHTWKLSECLEIKPKSVDSDEKQQPIVKADGTPPDMTPTETCCICNKKPGNAGGIANHNEKKSKTTHWRHPTCTGFCRICSAQKVVVASAKPLAYRFVWLSQILVIFALIQNCLGQVGEAETTCEISVCHYGKVTQLPCAEGWRVGSNGYTPYVDGQCAPEGTACVINVCRYGVASTIMCEEGWRIGRDGYTLRTGLVCDASRPGLGSKPLLEFSPPVVLCDPILCKEEPRPPFELNAGDGPTVNNTIHYLYEAIIPSYAVSLPLGNNDVDIVSTAARKPKALPALIGGAVLFVGGVLVGSSVANRPSGISRSEFDAYKQANTAAWESAISNFEVAFDNDSKLLNYASLIESSSIARDEAIEKQMNQYVNTFNNLADHVDEQFATVFNAMSNLEEVQKKDNLANRAVTERSMNRVSTGQWLNEHGIKISASVDLATLEQGAHPGIRTDWHNHIYYYFKTPNFQVASREKVQACMALVTAHRTPLCYDPDSPGCIPASSVDSRCMEHTLPEDNSWSKPGYFEAQFKYEGLDYKLCEPTQTQQALLEDCRVNKAAYYCQGYYGSPIEHCCDIPSNAQTCTVGLRCLTDDECGFNTRGLTCVNGRCEEVQTDQTQGEGYGFWHTSHPASRFYLSNVMRNGPLEGFGFYTWGFMDPAGFLGVMHWEQPSVSKRIEDLIAVGTPTKTNTPRFAFKRHGETVKVALGLDESGDLVVMSPRYYPFSKQILCYLRGMPCGDFAPSNACTYQENGLTITTQCKYVEMPRSPTEMLDSNRITDLTTRLIASEWRQQVMIKATGFTERLNTTTKTYELIPPPELAPPQPIIVPTSNPVLYMFSYFGGMTFAFMFMGIFVVFLFFGAAKLHGLKYHKELVWMRIVVGIGFTLISTAVITFGATRKYEAPLVLSTVGFLLWLLVFFWRVDKSQFETLSRYTRSAQASLAQARRRGSAVLQEAGAAVSQRTRRDSTPSNQVRFESSVEMV